MNKIEHDSLTSKQTIPTFTVHRWNSICQCLVCGELLEILTHAHAEKHGYKNKQEFVKAGKIRRVTIKYHSKNKGA